MAAKMASCGCGSPRGTALRSVLLGAWMACLSLAVVMATFAQAEEGQTDINGMEMLLEGAKPVPKGVLLFGQRQAEEGQTDTSGPETLLEGAKPVPKGVLLFAQRQVDKAMKNMEESSNFVEIIRGTGMGAFAAGAATGLGALWLSPSRLGTKDMTDGSHLSPKQISSREKKACVLGNVAALLLIGGAAFTFASWVTGLVTGNDARKQVERAIQSSAALKGLAPSSTGADYKKVDDDGHTIRLHVIDPDDEKATGDGHTVNLNVMEPFERQVTVSWTKKR